MNLAMELLEREPRRKFELRYIEKLFIFTKCNDPETVVNDLKTSLDTKYVDVFVYQGFDDVCVETSGNTTLFTVNPNWAGLKVSFKGKNGKTYSYEFDNVKLSFAMIKSLKVNSGGSNGQIRIIKKAANKINIALVGTTENYDVYVDYNKYQLKFIQSLKDSKGNLRISFTVEK